MGHYSQPGQNRQRPAQPRRSGAVAQAKAISLQEAARLRRLVALGAAAAAIAAAAALWAMSAAPVHAQVYDNYGSRQENQVLQSNRAMQQDLQMQQMQQQNRQRNLQQQQQIQRIEQQNQPGILRPCATGLC